VRAGYLFASGQMIALQYLSDRKTRCGRVLAIVPEAIIISSIANFINVSMSKVWQDQHSTITISIES